MSFSTREQRTPETHLGPWWQVPGLHAGEPEPRASSSTGPLRPPPCGSGDPGGSQPVGYHFLPQVAAHQAAGSRAHGHRGRPASPHGKRMGRGNRAGLPGCQLPARGLDTHQCNPESRVLAPAPQGNILGFHLFSVTQGQSLGGDLRTVASNPAGEGSQEVLGGEADLGRAVAKGLFLSERSSLMALSPE